jgi:hypothetical protein
MRMAATGRVPQFGNGGFREDTRAMGQCSRIEWRPRLWLLLPKGAEHGPHRRSDKAAGTLEQGQARRPKSPLKLKEIWAIRIRLQLISRIRDLALYKTYENQGPPESHRGH